MKILLTTFNLNCFSGSDLMIRDLAYELKMLGNEVSVFTLNPGIISDLIAGEGIPCFVSPESLKGETFDVIYAQHNITATIISLFFPTTPIFFNSLGKLPELEQPPLIKGLVDSYGAISEEVFENLLSYKITKEKITLLRNVCDTNKFRKIKGVNKKAKNLLVISNHFEGKFKDSVSGACKELNLHITHVGLPNKTKENILTDINNADIVISLGRGALESMACERNVVIADIHGIDGFVDEKSYYELRKNNFSGRRYAKEITKENIISEINKYNFLQGKINRNLVLKNHNLKDYVKTLISILNKMGPTNRTDLLEGYKDLINYIDWSLRRIFEQGEYIKSLEGNIADVVLEQESIKNTNKFKNFILLVRGMKK